MAARTHSLPGKAQVWAGSRHSTVRACTVRRCNAVKALAFPRTAHKETTAQSSQQLVLKDEPVRRNGQQLSSAAASTSQVSFLGSEDDVAGQTLYLHLRQDATVGQVVAMCNELAGRVHPGAQQRISGRPRPLHFATPSGRVDWDPINEELPEDAGPLLGTEAAALRLSVVAVAVDSREQLAAMRAHLGDVVATIQHMGDDYGSRSASF